jgi:hypothetical protein
MAKRKERPPTLDELKIKLKDETAARWLHSHPHFALLGAAHGNAFLPISPEAEKETLVIFLADVGDYLTERNFEILDLWRARYKKLNWLPIMVFQQKYVFLKNVKFLDQFKHFHTFTTLPIYLDPFGELFEKYGSTKEPVVLIFKAGELKMSVSLKDNYEQKILEVETALQACLRQEDPGLPLPVLHTYKIEGMVDTFSDTANRATRSGEWMESSASVATNDPQALLMYPFEGNSLRLVASLHPNAHENCRVTVTLDQHPIPHAALGDHVKPDDKGNTVVEINRFSGNYEIVKSDSVLRGILRFTSSQFFENAVIFYEFRSGKDSV